MQLGIGPFVSAKLFLPQPIFLFGIYAQENAEAIQSLQTVGSCLMNTWISLTIYSVHTQFTALLGFSAIFDIIWMATNAQNGFLRLITIIILLLKVCSPIIRIRPYFLLLIIRFRHSWLSLVRFVREALNLPDLAFEAPI